MESSTIIKLSQIVNTAINEAFDFNNEVKSLDIGDDLNNNLIYKTLQEWSKTGQLNISNYGSKKRALCKFKDNWAVFQNNIYDRLKKLGCQPIWTKKQIQEALKNGDAAIYTLYNSLGIQDCIIMSGFIDNKQTNLYTTYNSQDKLAEVILHKLWVDNTILLSIIEDLYNGIYTAYTIPKEIFVKIIKQNL